MPETPASEGQPLPLIERARSAWRRHRRGALLWGAVIAGALFANTLLDPSTNPVRFVHSREVGPVTIEQSWLRTWAPGLFGPDFFADTSIVIGALHEAQTRTGITPRQDFRVRVRYASPSWWDPAAPAGLYRPGHPEGETRYETDDLILVDPALAPADLRATLIHEMAHALIQHGHTRAGRYGALPIEEGFASWVNREHESSPGLIAEACADLDRVDLEGVPDRLAYLAASLPFALAERGGGAAQAQALFELLLDDYTAVFTERAEDDRLWSQYGAAEAVLDAIDRDYVQGFFRPEVERACRELLSAR